MQKKRFGRLKKAAIVLAVVAAASFLFMKMKPEPESIQPQPEQHALHKKNARTSDVNRISEYQFLFSQSPELVPEKEDKYGYLSYIKKTYTPENLRCKLHSGRSLTNFQTDVILNEDGFIQQSWDFNGLLAKENPGALIGVVNHLRFLEADEYNFDELFRTQSDIFDMKLPDFDCFLFQEGAKDIYMTAISSLAKIAYEDPDKIKSIMASLNSENSQIIFIGQVLANILDVEVGVKPDIRLLEEIFLYQNPNLQSLILKILSSEISQEDQYQSLKYVYQNTNNYQISRAIEKPISEYEKEMAEIDKLE